MVDRNNCHQHSAECMHLIAKYRQPFEEISKNWLNFFCNSSYVWIENLRLRAWVRSEDNVWSPTWARIGLKFIPSIMPFGTVPFLGPDGTDGKIYWPFSTSRPPKLFELFGTYFLNPLKQLKLLESKKLYLIHVIYMRKHSWANSFQFKATFVQPLSDVKGSMGTTTVITSQGPYS